jgi:predicted DNA-binding transcriptional regulator YafY
MHSRGEQTGELLVTAIRERRRVRFVYNGFRRIAEPHLVGIHEAGEAILSAFQLEGESRSGVLPGWRTFILSEIEQLEVLDEHFTETRSGYNALAARMTEVFARA